MTTKQEPNFKLLEDMYKDHLAGPEIYHASKFWDKLNQLNIDWLKSDGLNNFKRTVNNNYFNWMVTSHSDYFQNVARPYLRHVIFHPKKLLAILKANISEIYHRTYVSENTKLSYLQRKIYAIYLLFLHEYVLANDAFGQFSQLEEPDIGNPIIIENKGKRVSQDVSNSYMEYSYIRHVLGDKFSHIKTVAEIGGGYGRLSYLFHFFHQKDGVKIVLVDLPPALFVAQWYLKEVFPNANIMAYRNFSDFSEIAHEFNEASIIFLLPHQLELLPKGTIDLLINVSSLQEMSREQINHYYDLIDQKANYFYTKQWTMWHNAEDNIDVPAIIYPTKTHWQLKAARINPVHTSFFEAVFQLKP